MVLSPCDHGGLLTKALVLLLLFRQATLLMWTEVSCLMTSLFADCSPKMFLCLQYEWANLFLTGKEKSSIVWTRQWLGLWHFAVAIVVIKASVIQSLEIRHWVIPWCYSCARVELRCNFLHSFVRMLEKAHLTQEQHHTFKLSCIKTQGTSPRPVNAQVLSMEPKSNTGLKLLNVPTYWDTAPKIEDKKKNGCVG